MFDADSIHFPDSLKYKTLVKKRTVYGGGGIMPDYFVPMDTTRGTMFHANLNARGVINRTAISVVDNRRNTLLQQYPDVVRFMADFQISEEIEQRLRAVAAAEQVTWSEEEYSRSQSLIFVQLKALIARDLYDSSAFYRIINEESDIFTQGLQIISDDLRYEDLLQGIGSNVAQQK
jgi:carboxyl-terminal processing protease